MGALFDWHVVVRCGGCAGDLLAVIVWWWWWGFSCGWWFVCQLIGGVLLLGFGCFNFYLFWAVIVFIRLLVYLVLVLRLFAVVLIGVVFLVCGGCMSGNYFGFHLLAFCTFVIVALVGLVTLIGAAWFIG